MIITYVTYGEGGYDPTKPFNNLLEIREVEVADEVEE